MRKKETATFSYEACGECPHAEWYPDDKYKCNRKRKRIIRDLWGEIPKWCPLETVEGE